MGIWRPTREWVLRAWPMHRPPPGLFGFTAAADRTDVVGKPGIDAVIEAALPGAVAEAEGAGDDGKEIDGDAGEQHAQP
jgi:hypothetical protein